METTKQRMSWAKMASFAAVLVGSLLLGVFMWSSWVTAQQSQLDMVNGSTPMMGVGMMGFEMSQMQNNMEQMMQQMSNFMGMNMSIGNHNHE